MNSLLNVWCLKCTWKGTSFWVLTQWLISVIWVVQYCQIKNIVVKCNVSGFIILFVGLLMFIIAKIFIWITSHYMLCGAYACCIQSMWCTCKGLHNLIEDVRLSSLYLPERGKQQGIYMFFNMVKISVIYLKIFTLILNYWSRSFMFLTATWKYFACLHLKSLPLNGQYELPILGFISYT